MWILTRSHNDYNQYGEYFVDAWMQKPTTQQLHEHVCDWHWGPNSDPVALLLETGGGRQGSEDVWYELTQHKPQ